MNSENRNKLIKALTTNLDTRDKRFMFLKICFKGTAENIQLESTAYECAWNIYTYFEKQSMLGSLMACMNSYFDTDLYLDHEKD